MIKTSLQDIIILCVKTSKGGTLIQNKIKIFSLEDKAIHISNLKWHQKSYQISVFLGRKDVPRDLVFSFSFSRVSKKLILKIVADHPN